MNFFLCEKKKKKNLNKNQKIIFNSNKIKKSN